MQSSVFYTLAAVCVFAMMATAEVSDTRAQASGEAVAEGKWWNAAPQDNPPTWKTWTKKGKGGKSPNVDHLPAVGDDLPTWKTWTEKSGGESYPEAGTENWWSAFPESHSTWEAWPENDQH